MATCARRCHASWFDEEGCWVAAGGDAGATDCVLLSEGYEDTSCPGGCAGAMHGALTQMMGTKCCGLVGVWELLRAQAIARRHEVIPGACQTLSGAGGRTLQRGVECGLPGRSARSA